MFNPVSGTYQLTLTTAQSGQQCGPQGCFSTGVCAFATGATLPPPVSGTVRLDRSGDDLTIRADSAAGTFAMQLHLSGSSVSGTASGSFKNATTQLTLGAPGQTTLPAIGTLDATGLHGTLDGQMGSPSYWCSNNGHTWALR